jgi:excisionase family DNA binding protein
VERTGTPRALPEPAKQTDEFLSVSECARILKMSTRYVYDLLRSGKGPQHRRFGGRYRIRYKAFIEWASKPNQKGH